MPPIYRERMNEKKNYTYHLIAIFTVGVWGLTFISTKVLIANGLSPKEIFLLRFLIAYIGIWFISPRKLFANNWKDELWLLLGGITGGSVYFLTENMALGITLATNVAFIVCTAPLLTTIFSLMIYKKEKATRSLIGGSLMALVGVAMVVYNGSFVLKISPLGDCLTSCFLIPALASRPFLAFGTFYLAESAISGCACFAGLFCSLECSAEKSRYGACFQLYLSQSAVHFGRIGCPVG